MRHTLILNVLTSFIFLSSTTHAATPETTIKAFAVVTSSNTSNSKMFSLQNAFDKKPIILMNIHLSPKQEKILVNYPTNNKTTSSSASGLPSKADVGMNGVPVLDQGQHGTCTTFANTAAINALLGKGDYISQLCNLELGSYLATNGYYPSGWDGSLGDMVLGQMLEFGIVSKSKQKTKSCAGVTEYPIGQEYNNGKPFPLEQYKILSEDISSKIAVETVLNNLQRYNELAPNAYDGDKTLMEVKTILSNSARHDNFSLITFGVLLPVGYCSVGACASYHANQDTWAITKDIKADPKPEIAGHEMIIIAYDDNATATDQDGLKHKGLLSLRNSWGKDVGDKGNYYMTYDFFKQFVMEAHQVMKNTVTE